MPRSCYFLTKIRCKCYNFFDVIFKYFVLIKSIAEYINDSIVRKGGFASWPVIKIVKGIRKLQKTSRKVSRPAHVLFMAARNVNDSYDMRVLLKILIESQVRANG